MLEEPMTLDSDSDSDFKVTSIVPGKASRAEDEDEVLGGSKCTAMQPSVLPCEAAMPGMSAGSHLSEATRQAMEKSKALNQQLVSQLMGDDDDLSSSPVPLAPRGSLRMQSHEQSNFRQALQAATKLAETATTRTAEDEADEALLREDAEAIAAAAEVSGMGDGNDDGGKITIILQCRKGQVPIRTRKMDSFAKLQKSFLAVADSKGCVTSRIYFRCCCHLLYSYFIWTHSL